MTTLDTLALVLLALGAPVFLFELLALRRRGRLDRARVLEMLASASPLLPSLLVDGVVTTLFLGVFTAAHAWSPFRIPPSWWSVPLAVLLVDFVYYWEHRIAHEVRALWALYHSVHHSSPAFDQTTGLRVSFVDSFVSPWFYVPLAALGFPPLLVLSALLVVIAYQQWIHTELVGSLGPLEGILNTPSAHRVHHGSQPEYLDRNYGAVLMVWDRLFGTYRREDEPATYGLTEPLDSRHPWDVHFAELRRLVRDLRAARSFRARAALLLERPGLRPTAVPGSAITASPSR